MHRDPGIRSVVTTLSQWVASPSTAVVILPRGAGEQPGRGVMAGCGDPVRHEFAHLGDKRVGQGEPARVIEFVFDR